MENSIIEGSKIKVMCIKGFRYDSIPVALPKPQITEDIEHEVIEPKQLPEPKKSNGIVADVMSDEKYKFTFDDDMSTIKPD